MSEEQIKQYLNAVAIVRRRWIARQIELTGAMSECESQLLMCDLEEYRLKQELERLQTK